MATTTQKSKNGSTTALAKPRTSVAEVSAPLSDDVTPIDAIALPMGVPATTQLLSRFNVRHVVKLDEGQAITGKFAGEGPQMDVTDEATGEVRQIRTWLLQTSPSATAVLPGSVGLDKHFIDLDGAFVHQIGTELIVVRGPQTNTRKGRRVNQYLVGPAVDAKSAA